MEIIEYNDKYLEDVKDLLVELEEYILSIDKDNLDQLHKDYREKITKLDLEEVKENNGKCYLAIENDKAVGLIMGYIIKYDEYDYLDYKCPKSGEISELIVTNKTRSKGVGQLLINKLEEYFKSVGCEYIFVDVFAYNEIAKNFYSKNNYHSRMEIRLKKISDKIENFYLEQPSINRKQDALEYLNEHVLYKSKINGTGGLNKCLDGISYEQWLDQVIKMPNEEYAKTLGYVPGYTYFLVRKEDNQIIGMVNIRYNLTEKMLKYDGHIGYGIRPKEREKGYAKLQLYLALKKCKELCLDKIMIACYETNEASDRTIKALGGIFDRKEFDQDKNTNLNIYWINVDESIEKYKEQYEKIIKSKVR